MKKVVIAVCAIFALAVAGHVIAEETQHKGHTQEKAAAEGPVVKKQLYKCPMHPEVTSDKPGKCPKCGMFLEKVEPKKEEKK